MKVIKTFLFLLFRMLQMRWFILARPCLFSSSFNVSTRTALFAQVRSLDPTLIFCCCQSLINSRAFTSAWFNVRCLFGNLGWAEKGCLKVWMSEHYFGFWVSVHDEFLLSFPFSSVVATDDEKIADCCRGFGADVIMTSESCRNGNQPKISLLVFF